MENYFIKFPIINYNNITCRDISRNVRFSDKTKSVPTLFYPYEITSGLRSDVLSHAYYDDSTYDWLIYLTNGIVDPYYGWYLSENDFDDFLRKKYGSIEDAMRRIKYYRLDWAADDIDITPDFYENTLAEPLKKYYSPNYGNGSKIISYKRRQENWYSNTNKILNLTIDLNSNVSFANSELITIYYNELPVGNAEIIIANDSIVSIKNISGNTSANNIIVGRTTNASANVINSDVMVENISDEEIVYWNGISFFEYEREKNEDHKFISLLDANFALETAEELRLKLKE